MGWDTQVTVIAENLAGEQTGIARLLWEKDASFYSGSGFYYCGWLQHKKALIATYHRRKYLPYWVVQEISAAYPHIYFTVLGSSPEFISGPAGLIKICNGTITDSYGFFGEKRALLEQPGLPLIYEWFGQHGAEEKYRESKTHMVRKGWIEERFMDHLLDPLPAEHDDFMNRYNNMPLDIARQQGWIDLGWGS